MLNKLKPGAKGRVIEINGGKQSIRKLMGLGLRTGSDFELLHRRGNSVVLRSNGVRIAIGDSIAEHLIIEPLTEHKHAD